MNVSSRPCLSVKILHFLSFACAILLTVSSHAVIPQAAIDDPLFAKGYLVITHYPGVFNNESNAPSTRAGLQTAINDAFENDLVAYFPEGTYLIDNKLICHTEDPVLTPRIAEHQHVLVGSTLGERPLIKLAPNSSGYGSGASSPKPMIEFKNFYSGTTTEHEDSSYYEMLRGIDFDCGQNPNAYGVYFSAAQDCSIENVKVTATNAYGGFIGLPNSGWGAVNIEVEGGQYGVDLDGVQNGGTVISGAIFKNQTESAIRFDGFSPLALVGFEIVTPPASTKPAITIPGGFTTHHNSCLNLIDGTITCTTNPANAAIVNTANAGENLYIRNVSVKGTTKLIQSGTEPKVVSTGTGTWKRINEYVYCDQSDPISGQSSFTLLAGNTPDRTPEPATSITDPAPEPESDLRLRHIWASLPSVDDTDYVDAWDLNIRPGNVSASAFQTVINQNQKIFLRPGIYSVNSPGITLRNDTVLFGPARNLARIEPRSTWLPTSEVSIVSTLSDVNATTYLGDLTIGVFTNTLANSYFCALDWQAGGGSMNHIGRPYAMTNNGAVGQARSLLRVRNAGGGRWFFAGTGDGARTEHPDYRILDVEGTTQPLWFYGLNLEHARGDIYAEFTDAQNVRIYTLKTEYEGQGTDPVYCPLVSFNNTTNAALFGHGAIRHSAGTDRGCIEVLGTSDHVLASLIAPQNGGGPSGSFTLLDKTSTSRGVDYFDTVSLFKRGEIDAADDTAMRHPHIGYANVPSPWQRADIGSVGVKGSAGFGSDVFTVRGSGADIFGTADEFQFVHQTLNGDGEISARVLTQQGAPVGANAKAGVMIRETLNANSKSAQMFVMGSIGNRFHYRKDTSVVNSGTNDSNVAPYWVKVKRKGNLFSGYRSSDGINWVQVGSAIDIPMSSTAKVGLCVTSNNDAVLNTATFDNVKITPGVETSVRHWQDYANSSIR